MLRWLLGLLGNVGHKCGKENHLFEARYASAKDGIYDGMYMGDICIYCGAFAPSSVFPEGEESTLEDDEETESDERKVANYD